MALRISVSVCLLLLFLIVSKCRSGSRDSQNYIIHMDLSSMPKIFSTHHDWYLATLSSVSTSDNTPLFNPREKLIYSYTHAIHGFSAHLTPSELENIKTKPGYVSSRKEAVLSIDTTRSPEFLGLNPKYGAWPRSNYGKDVIIGVIDSGIWPESKSFNDYGMTEIPATWKGKCEAGTQFNSSMCNRKLIGARIFNRGLLAEDPNLTFSMNSARDTYGHGTHCASIAVGNYVEDASFFGFSTGTASGVAPRARLAVYKALWDEGTRESDVMAAMDQAIKDDVHVISASLAFRYVPLYEDPIAIAAFSAMQKGIFVSASAGNRGSSKGYRSLNNVSPWTLAVASGTVDRQFYGILSLDKGPSITGLSLYPGNSTTGKLKIVYDGACDNLDKLKKNRQKISVCLDSDDEVHNIDYQDIYLSNAKVAGGIFISNKTDLYSRIKSSFPALFLNPKEGQVILNYIKNNRAPKGRMRFRITRLHTKPAPQVASSSSRGPSSYSPFILKPDIMAPGVHILAAFPTNTPAHHLTSGGIFSSFDIKSGTSMACPHAAGVAALIKGVHPEWSPAAIRSAMMTTASLLDNTNQPIQDTGELNKPADPFAMGSGYINPNKALDPGLIYDLASQDYINYLCAMNFTSEQIKTITRESSSHNCSNPTLDLNYPSFLAYFNTAENRSESPITEHEFHRTVTYVGDGPSTYTAKLTAIEEIKVSVTPTKLVFQKKNEKQSFKVRVEGRLLKKYYVTGYLNWVDNGGKHEVRSPIIVSISKPLPVD